MSDETPNTTRDDNGRFVTRAAEKAHQLHTPSSEGIHPMAKILFGWTEARNIGSMLFWGIGLLGLFLIVIDVFVNRHDYFAFAQSTGFYGLYGFVCFAFVVLMGWPLGKLLRRGEDYYGDAGGPPADIDPDLPDNSAVRAQPTYEGDE